ncbi:nucleotidyltransferase family protein [Paraglaciecola sp. 25GB23A]
MTSLFTAQKFFALFAHSESIAGLSLKQWEQLLRILRGADMLGSFYYFLQRHEQLSHVPDFALGHLLSAKRYADRQVQQVNAEVSLLAACLAIIDCKPVFLKGAAYVLNNSSNHFGRVMSDIDILVPKVDLLKVENALKSDGWLEKKLDDYDEQYYRKWVHELPPFTHPERGVSLDVHHTIIPPITGMIIPQHYLFGNKIKTEFGHLTLSAEMVIMHCIIHLFYNEDYEKSFRDIVDIHMLLLDYESEHKLTAINQVANDLHFAKEWHYALYLCDHLFNVKRIDTLSKDTRFYSLASINTLFIKVIILPALIPSHDLFDSRWNKFARFVMFLRGHFLKMPLKILIPHFFVKSLRALVMLIMGPHHYEK